MSECEHLRIQTWMHEARPAGLWSCVECGHKFVPLDLSIERERDEAVAALRELDPLLDGLICYASGTHEYEPNRIIAEVRAVLAKIDEGGNDGTEQA